MKNHTTKYLATFCTTVAFTLLATRAAQAQTAVTDAYAVSSDHPQTYVDGAHRAHQDLRWDAARQTLVADVTYSTQDYADSVNGPEEDEFALAFPDVRFDAATKAFLAKGVTIANLRDGFLGPEVVLKPGLELSIHRHHGQVTAAIVRDYAED